MLLNQPLPPDLRETDAPDTVFGDLTWTRLQQVLTSHARQDSRPGVAHLLETTRAACATWTEAELCVELVAIMEIALQERTVPRRLCGTRADASWPEVLTMT